MEDGFEEFGLDFEIDEISLDIDINIGEKKELDVPRVYLYIENLVMIKQVKGLVDESEAANLVTVKAYAYKNEVLKEVGLVELTSENILTMQLLGLKVSLIRKDKEAILFDKAEHFVEIVKTLKQRDTLDDPNIPDEEIPETVEVEDLY